MRNEDFGEDHQVSDDLVANKIGGPQLRNPATAYVQPSPIPAHSGSNTSIKSFRSGVDCLNPLTRYAQGQESEPSILFDGCDLFSTKGPVFRFEPNHVPCNYSPSVGPFSPASPTELILAVRTLAVDPRASASSGTM